MISKLIEIKKQLSELELEIANHINTECIADDVMLTYFECDLIESEITIELIPRQEYEEAIDTIENINKFIGGTARVIYHKNSTIILTYKIIE